MPAFCAPAVCPFTADEAAVVSSFKDILWPQDLQRVLVTPGGMVRALILNCWLQY
jgi:hypothetical protein